MQSVTTGVRRGAAWLALLIALSVQGVYADDGNPYDPPQAVIRPPSGVTSQVMIRPPSGATSRARIQPPVGISPESRIRIPTGVAGQQEPPSLMELFIEWLQTRISYSID